MSREFARRYLMSISHTEFLRCLEPLGRDYPYRSDETGKRIILRAGDGHVKIRLGEERSRHLGSLELTEITIDIQFHNVEADTRERFFRRFDLCFRRGGG